MLGYYNQFEVKFSDMDACTAEPLDLDLAYELLATSLAALAVANRLLSALGDVAGDTLERDAVYYSSEILRHEASVVSTSGWANYYLNQKASIARSISTTTMIWKTASGEVIDGWRFDSWCKALRRRTCCCSRSSSAINHF